MVNSDSICASPKLEVVQAAKVVVVSAQLGSANASRTPEKRRRQRRKRPNKKADGTKLSEAATTTSDSVPTTSDSVPTTSKTVAPKSKSVGAPSNASGTGNRNPVPSRGRPRRAYYRPRVDDGRTIIISHDANKKTDGSVQTKPDETQAAAQPGLTEKQGPTQKQRPKRRPKKLREENASKSPAGLANPLLENSVNVPPTSPVKEKKGKEPPEGRRLFGRFDCADCAHRWSSVSAWKGIKQACKLCGVMREPTELRFLFRRRRAAASDEPAAEVEGCSNEEKEVAPDLVQHKRLPHPQHLCEMCMKLQYCCRDKAEDQKTEETTDTTEATESGGNREATESRSDEAAENDKGVVMKG